MKNKFRDPRPVNSLRSSSLRGIRGKWPIQQLRKCRGLRRDNIKRRDTLSPYESIFCAAFAAFGPFLNIPSEPRSFLERAG
jgi:hypothetical protein